MALIFILTAGVFVKLVGLGYEALFCCGMAMVWINIGLGIHGKSLLAASAGLVLWLMLAIWVWMEWELFTVIDTVFLTWLFVNGLRETLRWNEIRRVL